jgi:penicillin-binding protein 2
MGRSSFMDDDAQAGLVINRRALVLGAGAGALFLTLSGRLGWLQIVEGKRYAMLAEDNRISVKILPPLRGQIVDRYGVPLADNARNYRVVVIPEQARPIEETMRVLQDKLALSDREVAVVLKQAKVSRSFAPIDVRDYLSWEQVATVEVNLPDLPGVSIEEGYVRTYPFSDATAHLIGYVGTPSEKETENVGAKQNALLRTPGFRIGKGAMERALEADLRGSAGNQEVEVNVRGRVVRELSRKEPVHGERLSLSIDADLQQQLQARLSKERSASAVIMDVHTGEVYALASYPSFDPNQFSRQLTHALWQELLNDERAPLANKAVAGQYPPGSTFKMVTALAALEAGIIDENTHFHCPGHYNLGNIRFHCWRKEGHGNVNVVTALEQSCDTFFYEVGNRLGIDRIAAMARRLGLGERLDIELAEEQPGLVPDKDWKKRGRPKDPKWHPGETINASIGQGYLLTTPLQLATMVSRLVNGGKAVKPWLVGYAEGQQVHDGVYPDIGLNKDHLELVLRGMWQVVNRPSGTAFASRLKMDTATMGGKTGTSQVQRITAAQRAAGVKNEDLPWKQRHHALFVGYAPTEAPRYAIGVVVEHGVGGSKAAAPIARDLLTLALKRNPSATKIESQGAQS